MRTLIAMLVLGLMSGCGGKPSAAAEQGGGGADTPGKRVPKWKVDYSGELEGSIQGSILSVQTMIPGTVVLAGAAFSPDRTARAAERLSASIVTSENPPTATVKLTLADGTRCRSRATAATRILDGDRESFHAELSGALECGGDRAVTFEATLRSKV